eukprot:121839-Karenia_brevis.AAC.1
MEIRAALSAELPSTAASHGPAFALSCFVMYGFLIFGPGPIQHLHKCNGSCAPLGLPHKH